MSSLEFLKAQSIFRQVFSQDADLDYKGEGGPEAFYDLEKPELIRHIITTQFTAEQCAELITQLKSLLSMYETDHKHLNNILHREHDLSYWEDPSVPGEKGIVAIIKLIIQELERHMKKANFRVV